MHNTIHWWDHDVASDTLKTWSLESLNPDCYNHMCVTHYLAFRPH